MSGPGVGYEKPPVAVTWLKRDALLFAVSIGATVDELQFVFEQDPNFKVFPTYPTILPFKHTDQDVVDFHSRNQFTPIPGVPKFSADRIVDGQRSMVFYKEIPTSTDGRQFELREKILGVYDKGKVGTVIENEQLLVDKVSGETYAKIQGSMFYLGQGNWGGPKGPKSVDYPAPKGRKPDAISTHQLTDQSPLIYRLNGDYNRLHVTLEPGKGMGFGGPIMHGLFTYNVAAHGVLKEVGDSNPANMREFQARFAAPVKPGDKLLTEIWRTGEYKEGWEEVRFVTSVVGGKVVLSNGRALIRPVRKDTNKL